MSNLRSKGSESGRRVLARLAAYIRVTAGVAALLSNTAAWSQNAPRLPTGGTVAAGTATIGTPSNGTLNINQSTNQAIINWNTFSVGKGGTVNFNQPSTSSSTLNRVLGTTPSWIAGTINAPGTVLLVNPNGIAITKSGVVNTGSFAASTLDISNADFMAGNYKFQGNGGSAAVRNAGRINVSDGGFAALLGGQVSNSGVISARLGKVGLGAGELITLDLAGDGFLSVAVPSSQLGKLVDASGALVSNRGKIRANGGQVFLNAATASNILRDAVNVPGTIRANSVGTHNGRIVIGGGYGRVNITGRLAANGGGKKGNRGNGGKIEISAANVALNGKITANGKTGGAITVASAGDLSVSGKVEAKGGGEQGGRIDLGGANIKVIGALIDASGAAGGQVSIISGGDLSVFGTITATGSDPGRSGGFIETSGLTLKLGGRVYAGRGGTWLLDPNDLTIDSTLAAMINAALNAGTDVIEQTTAGGTGGNGDIFVNSALSWSTTATLTLSAYRNIDINSNITISGGGGLVLTTNTGGGDYTFAGGSSISFTGGANSGASLAINGNPYTLLYSISDVQGINPSNAALGQNYALSTSLDATTTTGWVPLGTNGAGTVANSGNGFTGTFAGLGHTISNLTVTTGFHGFAGLFGYSSGTIRDIGVVNVSVTGGFNAGGLAGVNFGTIRNAYATGMVSAGDPFSTQMGGLVGTNTGTISNAYASVAVSGASALGGLVGDNNGGTISDAYATGTVSVVAGATNPSQFGGLVGINLGTINVAYATGAVTGSSASTRVGGLVGQNVGTIANAYATGAVIGGTQVGGLVGESSYAGPGLDGFGLAINAVYATGAVSGNSNAIDSTVAALIGQNGSGDVSGTFDQQTVGPSGFVGIGFMGRGTVAGLSTTQLQNGGLQSLSFGGFSTSVWGGATGGIYPYLKAFFPNGVQAVSGIAYQDAGVTVAASGANGAVPVTLTVNGVAQAAVTTGVNGYYYATLPAGAISAGGTTLLAYTQANAATGAENGASFTSATGTTTGLDIYGSALRSPTSATTYSASKFAVAHAALAGYGTTPSFVANLSPTIVATGASFTLDQALDLTSSLAVQTTAANAPLTVADPITITSGASLGLNAAGALTIAAPIAVNGAGAVSLAYNTSAPTNLSFGLTSTATFAGGITYNAANGAALTASPGNQSLSVNGAPYTLLYNMTDVAGVNSALGGNYALATNIDASASIANPYTGAVVGSFSGTFEGLGNTISNLSIQTPANQNAYNVALFAVNSGTMRDFALAGGQVTAGSNGFSESSNHYYDFLIAGPNTNDGYLGTQSTGSVVGQNAGMIVNVATSAAVTGDVAVGGLAGANTGTILNSMASGVVSAGTSYVGEGIEVGGLVGLNYMGTVSGSWATGAVSGYTMVGGLIGAHNDATTTGSYAIGAVTGYMNVGGLIGNLEGGSLQSSHATGAVTGLPYQYEHQYVITNASTNVGGLIGQVYDSYYAATAVSEQSTSISSSYATGNVTAANGFYVGGLIGFMNTNLPNVVYASQGTTLTGVYATGTVSGSQNVGGLAGQLAFATLNNASATGAVSGNQAVGGLVGQAVSATLNNATASGVVTGAGSGVAAIGGLVGLFNAFYGPGYSGTTGGTNLSATGAVSAPDGANYVGGLVGLFGTAGTLSNASATGTVTVGANASNIGGLIGANGTGGVTVVAGVYVYGGFGDAQVSSSSASGAVTAGDYATAVGGLMGSANDNGSGLGTANSYATGSVTVGKHATNVGGLIGDDEIQGEAYNSQLAIQNDFATGSVTAGAAATNVGGLFGTMNSVEIDGVYATGAVTVGPSSSAIGGFAGAIGPSSPSIPLAAGVFEYIDLYGFSTGRVSAGPGSTSVDASIGANGQIVQPYDYIVYNSDTAGVGSTVGIAERTADFTQNGSVASALNSNLSWAGTSYTGGTNGLYPYQPQIFPNGVQAITGYAYNANGTAATGTGVALAGLGSLGQASTGANGAYYIALPAGTLGATALETAATLNAATLTPVAATGVVQSGVNLYANTLSTVTGATLASAAPTQVATIAAATTAAGTDAAALATLAGATGYGLISTGASFTLDQSVTSSGTFVAATTKPSAPLTVAAPVAAAGAVLLQTSGPLRIAAGGSVSGASPVLATTGAFVNDAGSAAVTATSGAWQIFSAAPGGDTFGGLNSNDTAIWNAPAGSAVTASGNRYVFATAPVLTVATVNDSKTYGVDATSAVASDYMITGYQAGVAGAYLGDSAATVFSGAADVTSTGSASTAVIGSYGYQLALGSLVSNAGYGFTLANTGTFTVNAAALTITASSQTKTYGQVASLGFSATGLVTANGDMMSGVTLASAGAAASASVNGGTPYAVTASNATGTGLSNYTITYVNGALTVTPAALTITASNQTKTYGQVASLGTTAFMQTGLVTANGDAISGVTLASTGAAATANVAGSPYAITASSATGTGLSNYTVSYVNGALTVNPLAVTLSGTQVYNGTTTAAGSALAVTNLVGSDSVTVGGSGTMAAKDVGSQALASLTGLTLNNTNYTLVGGSGAVNVTPATLTYTADTASRTYGASNPALSGAVAGFVGADTQAGATTGTLGFTTTATTASNVGAYAINGSGLTAVNGNYTFVQAPANSSALMVTTATLTITASNQSKTYGTNLVLGTTGFTMSGLVTANGDTVTGVTLASLGAAGASVNGGTPYIITASNAVGNRLSNYTISYVSGGLTVNPLAVTLSGTQVYNGTTTAAGSALAVTNLVGSDSLTIGGSGTMAAKDVGSQALASLTGLTLSNANYTLVGGSGAVNVTPATLTYTANAASRIYGAANPALSGAVTGFVGSDTQAGATSGTLGFATTATTASNIGSYAINGSGLSAVNGNYTFVQSANSSALTVNPATLTITASSQSKTYGQPASLGFSATGLVTANGDAINAVTMASAGAAAGASVNGGTPYTVTASNATGTGLSNYTISYVNGGLTVNPLAVTLAGTQAYNGTTTVAGPSLAVTNLVGNDSATVSGSGTMAAKDVGSQALALLTGLTLNNGNYTLVGGSGTVIVTPATLAYAADAASRTYGAANPALSGMVTGFLGSDTQANATSGTLGFTTTATTASNFGSYAINGSGLSANNGNYTFVQASANSSALTVNPATLTITASSQSKTYGQTASLGFSATGLVTANSDAINGVTLASAGAAAGASVNGGTPYAVTASNATGTGLSNYTISYVNGGLTVNPLAVTLSGTQVYNGTTTAAGSALAVTNLAGSDSATVSGSGTMAAKDVGSQALALLTGLTLNNGNYTLVGGSGTVTVTPATLTYTANPASRTYGAANPALSGTVTGFLGSDTQTNATSGAVGFATTAATASNIGSYAINGSGLSANNGNYTFVQAPPNNMALTVNPAPITVTAVANTKTYDGTTSAAAAPIVTAGTIYGSDSGSFTEVYTSRNAGTGLTLTPSGTINDRNGGANYAITFVASANGTISPRAVILTGTQTYDGTTNARSASLTVANVVGNDNVGLDGTAVLMSKEVGPEALTLTNGRLTGLSVSNSNYTVTGGNGTVTVTPPAVAPAGTQPSKGTADPSHFDVTVNGGTAPSNSVDITFQNPTSGPFPISFTPPTRVANTPSTDVAPASLSPGRDLATNNGLTYLPVGQFDPNQYSQFKVPDYAAQAGEATIFATIARAADPEHAADDLIDTFWNGTSGAWTPPKSAKVEKVTFSDGAGNKIDPTGNAGFPIISGSTDFVQLLKTGPLMISDGGQPAHWLLATQMTADGKGIVANDPASGKQVVLSYDASTKSVGGITGVIDANSHKFVSFAEASASTPALVGLQSFVPANFLAVSTN